MIDDPGSLAGKISSWIPVRGADIIEVEGSHVIMISQPHTVTDQILKAAQAVATPHR